MSAAVDWTGWRASGAEVLNRGSTIDGVTHWAVRCACGALFVVPSHRLRHVKAHQDGRRKTPCFLCCGRCTSRARAAAVTRRGGFQSMRRAS